MDYAARISAYLLDLETSNLIEKSTLIPFGKGLSMPDNAQDPIEINNKGVRVSFNENENGTTIHVHWPKFHNDKPLQAQLTVERTSHQESLNTVIPWNNKRYQFTSKQIALPVHGEVIYSEGTYQFLQPNAFATLNVQRGKWPYKSHWNSGSASGFADGYKIGLNFTGQMNTEIEYSENGIIIDYQLHKIREKIDWIYDKNDYMKPWVIHTPHDQQVKLMFEPIFKHVSIMNLGLIHSKIHQMIGYYNGTIETNDGETIQVEQLLGWVEDCEAKW